MVEFREEIKIGRSRVSRKKCRKRKLHDVQIDKRETIVKIVNYIKK